MIDEDIGSYEYDPYLGNALPIFIVIKGFKQLEIVKKIIERKGNKSFGLTAVQNSTERKYSHGQIILTDLTAPEFNETTLQQSPFRIECLEPFDVTMSGNYLAYTAGSAIGILDRGNQNQTHFTNDWMSFLHSVEFSRGADKILTASAGFDTVLELDIETGRVVWEWNFWDHGFNYSELANVFVTRNRSQLHPMISSSACVKVVEDPKDWPREGIPTNESPTRLNGASYGLNDTILVTAFHRPELFLIERSGHFEARDLGLSHPHGFRNSNPSINEGYEVTNTGMGEFLLLDPDLDITHRLRFSELPANPEKKAGFGEWIQSVILLQPDAGLYGAIDALRDGTHVFDFIKKKRRFIPNPTAWTLQKLVAC